MSSREYKTVFAPRELGKDCGQATYTGLQGNIDLDGEGVQTERRSSAESILREHRDPDMAMTADDRDTSLDVLFKDQAGSRVSLDAITNKAEARPVREGDSMSTQEVHFGPTSDHKKPGPTYFMLLKHALLFSPQKKLTLGQIYEALEGRWPWFSYAGKGWKNTVRNVLSLGPSFQKASGEGSTPRPSQGGVERGVYWAFDPTAVEGTPREDRNKKRSRHVSRTDEDVATPFNKARRGRKQTGPGEDGDEEASDNSSMTGIVEHAHSHQSGDRPSIESSNVGSGAPEIIARDHAGRPSTTRLADPPMTPIRGDNPHARPTDGSLTDLVPISVPKANIPKWSSLPSGRTGGSPMLYQRPSSSGDPSATLASSAPSSPLSTTSPPVLSPSSASTSLSSLEEWFGPNPGTASTWMAEFEGSLKLATMDEDIPHDTSPPSQPEGSSSGLQLYYPSQSLDSPMTSFAEPSPGPSTVVNGTHAQLLADLAPVAIRGSRFAGHKTHPIDQHRPLQQSSLAGHNRDPPQEPSEGTASSSVTASPSFDLAQSAPPKQAVAPMPDRASANDDAGTGAHLSESAAALPSTLDLSSLVGRSAEFWRGLWDGWNASSPNATPAPAAASLDRARRE